MAHKILVVDDEPTQRRLIEHVVKDRLKFDVDTASGGQEAIDYVLSEKTPDPDLILLDLCMPKVGGMDVIRAVRPLRPHLPIIVLTMHGDLEKAVAAIKAGATDFLAKPVPLERLNVSLQNALNSRELGNEVQRLQRQANGQLFFSDMIGKTSRFKDAVALAKRACQSRIPVLIEGESGVGKELMARAIHGCSERGGKPFVAVNCGAIPENLVESILFGHEKGAFTGALYRTMGKFREADGGTLFLDEVGELAPDLQVKLLRALQEGVVEPVGARGAVAVDVRVISATNRHLEQRVQEGAFREDLFYRLNVFPLTVPPLRQRRGDIAPLAEHFLRRFAATERKPVRQIAPLAMEALVQHSWPGNIRQLENAIFRGVVLCESDTLEMHDFGALLPLPGQPADASLKNNRRGKPQEWLVLTDTQGNVRSLLELEAEMIRFALQHYEGHMSEVARRLGIGRSTLYRKMSDFQLTA